MSFDITHLLDQWDYQAGQVVVRKFKGKDGVEKIQLRVDLGVLQMNARGRPDGKLPRGRESLYEFYQHRLTKHRAVNKDDDTGFSLNAEDCGRLQQEAIQYHHRYICLFQLEDYQGVIRDTERNLRVFDLVEKYADNDDVSWSLQQFRPQLLMMRTRAAGAASLQDNDYEATIKHIQSGIEALREFYHRYERLDLMEQSGEIQSLEAWLNEVRGKRPQSEREKLEKDLQEAVRREDFEQAAKVRDALRKLKTVS